MNQTMLQGRLAIFRINYKSDFIITLNSDAGWMTPFCIKFWTGAPSQAYFAGWDGTTYTNCAPVAGEPTKLQVQFDDHHLPIGELKYQIGYHFTVADFPTTVEDEVLNQERVVISHDGQDEKVLLDFNGETAPDIQFSLPAYANEAQRIANEEQRIANEAIRIVNEEVRIIAEQTRQQNEEQRIAQETARVQEFATLKSQSQAATRDANDAATLANQKAQLAADKAALAQSAADLANAKAQLAADKAALAASAAQLANDKAALAQQKAEYAQTQGTYAKNQGDYAKQQGDYAKNQGDTALADHLRAEADHETAASDHTRAESDHSTASSDHTQAGNDHTRAESDHSTAASDHTTAGNDHTRAESDHSTAASDHTTAGNDHTRAESDHTRAESDHAAVEVYVDSLGAYDISAAHAVGGVLATYANLQAALGNNGENIPELIRKGGMSVKFVQSSDNKYVQYRLMATSFSTTPSDWQGVDNEPTVGSNNLVKSGGVAEYVVVEGAALTPTSSYDRFYAQDLSYIVTSQWKGQIYDIAVSEQNQGIIVDCAPRSNGYTSLTDTNNNILWQSNNANDFPKQLNFSDYPTAAKLYISSEKSVNPNPYCKPIKNIKDVVEELSEQVPEIQQRTISNAESIAEQGEAISDIKEELVTKGADLVPVSVRKGFYQQDLSYQNNSTNFKSPLYTITEEQKAANKGVFIDAAPRSAAYVSITDANDDILWQSNLASDFPRVISFKDYPSIGKIYLSNEFVVKETYKAIFVTKIAKVVEELNNKTSILNDEVIKLSDELSKAFFSNKVHGNNYDSAKKVTLPSEFQNYSIPIDISRDGNVFGWSTDVKKMQKNNEYTATYYCSPNGNNENSGLTVSAPLKTLDIALAKSDLNTLVLLPGTYVCGEHFTSDLSVDKEINIIGIGSVEMKCKSASEYPIHIENGCYVENIVFNGGHGELNVSLSELTQICVFYKCKFLNSHSTNGLNALGGSYYLEECEASNNARDGFNYHNNTVDNNTIFTRAIEINCCGYFNGLNHDSYINNGSTTHDSGRIIRLYCEYGSCKGSVVADANRTKSLNIGVTAYSTANIDGELDSQKANFAAQQGSSNPDVPQIFYIIQCSSFGSLFDIYADNNAIIYRDTPFPREGTNGTATIVDYDLL